MARPRKHYVVYENGRAIAVVAGLDEARKRHSGWQGFTSLTAAEEHAAWHNHARDLREATAEAQRQETPATPSTWREMSAGVSPVRLH